MFLRRWVYFVTLKLYHGNIYLSFFSPREMKIIMNPKNAVLITLLTSHDLHWFFSEWFIIDIIPNMAYSLDWQKLAEDNPWQWIHKTPKWYFDFYQGKEGKSTMGVLVYCRKHGDNGTCAVLWFVKLAGMTGEAEKPLWQVPLLNSMSQLSSI